MTKAARWPLWWAASMLLWLVLTSTVSLGEVITGFIASALVASEMTVLGSRETPASRPPLRWLRYVAPLPRRIVVDTWVLTLALARRVAGTSVRGRTSEVSLPTARSAGERRAVGTLATILTSMSPNTIVVDIDERRRVAVLHEVAAKRHDTIDDVLRGR
jgi:multisubunit Na+/H+ antiporter MnhE subunit